MFMIIYVARFDRIDALILNFTQPLKTKTGYTLKIDF